MKHRLYKEPVLEIIFSLTDATYKVQKRDNGISRQLAGLLVDQLMGIFEEKRHIVLKERYGRIKSWHKEFCKKLAIQTRASVEAYRKTNGVKIGRNDPCHCGSGKKYKLCCGR